VHYLHLSTSKSTSASSICRLNDFPSSASLKFVWCVDGQCWPRFVLISFSLTHSRAAVGAAQVRSWESDLPRLSSSNAESQGKVQWCGVLVIDCRSRAPADRSSGTSANCELGWGDCTTGPLGRQGREELSSRKK
jgi:hypothetical protein